MPTSRSPFGVNIAPLPFPDFQTDINKQLSFWNTMQAMQNRAAGGGRVPRNENGLTPWQQLQADEKKAKAEAKAAEAEAKKNVMLGLDPVSKEPIIYRNESGQNLTQKDRDRLLADELQRRLKNAAGQDVELNKALGELNSGTELSTQRRSELQRVVRDRTKALGREYGIDDRATFDAIIGPSKQVLDEQRQVLRNDSFLDTVWAGMRKGGNALYYAATMPFMSDAERLEAAEQMRKEQEAITRSSPTLQERALVEAEAAREGKDVGYMQAAQANLASNIGASVADTVMSFAPAIAAGMIPVVGTYAAPFLAGGIGAGLNQVSQAARVEADPNLTEAQKQQALSYSDPGFVGTTVLGGATGAMFPGSIGSGIARGAGSAAFRRAAAAGPINPANVSGITGRALRAGAKATERANAPRSLAALSRDVPVNMAENAGLMAANTVGANMAYNASVGQPLTQGAMEGAGRAAMEGAIIGVPFGVGRTLRRRAAPTAQATTEGTVSPTGEPANTQPVSIFEQAMKANKPAQEWKNELIKTVRNPRKVDSAAADKLVAEYLDTVDRGAPDWRDEMTARLVSIDELPAWNKMNEKSAEALHNVVGAWKGALDDGTIAEKIASNYQRPAEGESRLASYMGELERVRAERAAGQGTRDDSKVATNPADSASDVASGNPVQNNAGGAETPGGGDGGTAAQNGRPPEAPSAASPQAGGEGTPASQQPANAGSTGAGGKSSGNGTGESTPPAVGRDGSTGNAATPSGGEQSADGLVITYRPNGTHTYDYAPRHDVLEVEGKAGKSVFFRKKGEKLWRVYNPNAKKFYSVASRDVWNNTPDDIREIGKNYSTKNGGIASKVMSKALTELADSEAAKSTNPKGEVKESRFLPRQQYSSAGTSRKQVPESFKKIPWTQGTRNLDIGAGAFELGTDYLRSRGVENTPFDPYNRTRDVNNAALDTLRNGEKYDTVTVANLLNVVQEPEIRDNIIKQAAHSVKPDGKAYFQVYESDRSGVGRQTKTGGTDDNWQNARTLKSYQPDIERHFGKVESKDGMLIASEPKDPGPVEWQLNKDGDTVREQRGFHGGADFDTFNLDYAGSGEGGSAHGWGVYAALEETSPFSPDDSAKKSHTRGKATAKKYRAKVPEYDTATVVLKGKRWNINEEDVVEAPDGTDPDGSTIAAVLAIHRAKGDITQARSALEHEGQKLSKDIQELQQEIRTAPNDSFRENLSNMLYYDEIFLRENQRAYDLLKNLDTVEYKLQEHRGRVYTVEVPESDVLLHENLPMSKQPKKVRESVQKLLSDDSQDMFMRTSLEDVLKDDMRGASFYNRLVYYLGSKEEASYLLNHYGIEGIYAFGRNDGPIAVIFNDEAIKILLKERRIAEGSAVSPEVIDAYLTTPAERKLAATLNRTDVDSPIFPSLLQQFTDTMLKKFKGIPNRQVVLSSRYPDVSEQATGWYDRRSQRIGMNPENIFDRFDTVENALHTMSHEIGHDVLDTRVPRSVRTAISTDAYNAAETGIARVAKRAYSDMNRTAQGEEIFVETAARENPFLDPAELGTTPREYAEDIVSLTLDGLGAGNADSAAAAREMVHFLATNAPSDIGNFGDIATTVLTSNKDIVEAFTNPNVQTTGLMQELATDYRNKVQEAGLSGYSVSTMRDYLSAVLDPRTSMDVYARTTKLC